MALYLWFGEKKYQFAMLPKRNSQALVAHTCNPNQEAEIRRIMVQGQPGQIGP
jgi:hypothetical protein